jgi:hypothetical protein
MISPGAHEDSAVSELLRGETQAAQVHAILALASAVNRLAQAQENIAST